MKNVIVICIGLFIGSTAHASWRYAGKNEDVMTNEFSAHAHSINTKPLKLMSFPYQNVVSWMGYGCSKDSEWAYIGFSGAPNLNDTETEDGYNSIVTRIKWGNDEVNKIRLTQDWGEKFIHFVDDESSIRNIMNNSSVLLELNWHGQGNVHFKFSLDGSTKAINSAQKACGIRGKQEN